MRGRMPDRHTTRIRRRERSARPDRQEYSSARRRHGPGSPCAESRFGQAHEPLGNDRVTSRRGLKVWFQPYGMEDVVRLKLRSDGWIPGGRFDESDQEHGRLLAAKAHVDFSTPQLRLPDRVSCRVQKRHREHSRIGIMGENFWHGVRCNDARNAEPGDLELVSINGGTPVGGDLELGKRPLHRENLTSRRDLENVRRDAAGEWLNDDIGSVVQTQHRQDGFKMSHRIL